MTAGEGRLAVVGGCVVSPQGEVIGSNMSISETNFLLEASSKLQKRYQSEGNMAGLGGEALQSTILDSKTGLSDIYRQAASISSSIYRLEQETRKYESDIVQQWNLSKATRAYQVQKARHTNPFLDVHFYDVNETMWKEQVLYTSTQSNSFS